MSTRGITMNFSMVDDQNGECNMGFKCHSSEGIDIDYNIAGEDPESMMEELLDDVSADIIKQYAEIAAKTKKLATEKKVEKTDREKELEEIIKKLQKENASLRTDNKILQKRSDEKVNKEMNEPKKEKSKADPSRFFYDDDHLLNLLKLYF